MMLDKAGEHGDMFEVRKITSGKHAGMYFLMDKMTSTVM